jgi:hypothetical protein
MPVYFSQPAKHQPLVVEKGGEKWVKSGEKSSQPAKNQSLAPHAFFPGPKPRISPPISQNNQG